MADTVNGKNLTSEKTERMEPAEKPQDEALQEPSVTQPYSATAFVQSPTEPLPKNASPSSTTPLPAFASSSKGDSAAAASLSVGEDLDVALKKEKSRARQRIGIAIVAVASVALIGVSAWFLLNPSKGEAPVSLSLETTSDGESTGENAASDSVESEQDPAEDGASSASENPSFDVQGDEGASGSGQPGAGSGDGQSSDGGNAPSASTSNASGSSNAGASGSNSSNGGQPAPEQAPHTVSVSISVSSSVVGGPVSGSGSFEFEEGATVYDALMALNLSVNAQNSATGIYVAGIGGLAEKQHGGQSGWKYSVNGVDANMSCAAYVLHDGDVVAWRYVTSLDG